MVKPVPFLAFLIFSVGAAPFAAIVTLGLPNVAMFAVLIAVSALSTLFSLGVRVPGVLAIALLLAVSELISGALIGIYSINFARIFAAFLATVWILSHPLNYYNFFRILHVFHRLIVLGFVITLIAVFLAGTSILHGVSPFSDPMVLRKAERLGSSFGQIGIFNFILNGIQSDNIFRLSVTPTGTSSEAHMFFSFVLVSTALLIREHLIGWQTIAVSAITMAFCISYSNAAGLAVAGSATALLYMFQFVSMRRFGIGIFFWAGLTIAVYLWQDGYLDTSLTQTLLILYDRSIAESVATIARFMSFDFGAYPLESIPNLENDLTVLPVNIASFVLFTLFLGAVLWKVTHSITKLGLVGYFLIIYILVYSLKSFGVMLFHPFFLMALWLTLHGPRRMEPPPMHQTHNAVRQTCCSSLFLKYGQSDFCNMHR